MVLVIPCYILLNKWSDGQIFKFKYFIAFFEMQNIDSDILFLQEN